MYFYHFLVLYCCLDYSSIRYTMINEIWQSRSIQPRAGIITDTGSLFNSNMNFQFYQFHSPAFYLFIQFILSFFILWLNLVSVAGACTLFFNDTGFHLQVYIIDFGLAKKYRDLQTHRHIPYRYICFCNICGCAPI